jgi:subtilisin family serine protease
MGAPLRIGIVDSGVNPWHSHVGGEVAGCRLYVDERGCIAEDADFRDRLGHGTAVAGVIRQAFPDAEIFAVRVFDDAEVTYPSLVARAILRAAAERCEFVNVSVAVDPGAGADVVAAACAAALESGVTLVAATRPDRPGALPASLPGVHAVSADDALAPGEVCEDGPLRLRAAGTPRDLETFPREANLHGHSFACARALVHLARRNRPDASAAS